MGLSVRVAEVTPLENMWLWVKFEDGTQKKYDVRQLIPRFPIYQQLEKDPALFCCVQVDCGGCGIAWNADIDISECELYDNGVML